MARNRRCQKARRDPPDSTKSHYVVLERVSDDRFSIVDPAAGRRSMREAELLREFSGIVIAVEPTDSTCLMAARSRATDASFHIPIPVRRREWSWVATVVLLAIVAGTIAASHMGNVAQSGLHGAMDPGSIWLVLGCAVVVLISETVLLALDKRMTAQTGAAVAQYFVDGIQAAPPAYVASRTPHFLEYTARNVDPLFNPQFPRPTSLARAVGTLALVAVVMGASVPVGITIILLCAARLFSLTIRRTLDRGEQRGSRHLYAVRERLRAIFMRPEDLLAAGGLGYALHKWLATRARVAAARDRGSRALLLPHGVGLTAALGTTFLIVLLEYRRARLSFGDTVEIHLLATAALTMWWSAAIACGRLLVWTDSVAALHDIRRERSTIESTAESAEASPSSIAPLLECRGVSWESPVDDAPLLQNVQLVVRAGESVAVIGASGSGKSLLAQIILGLRNPSRGLVFISGSEVRRLGESVRGAMIAGVLDDATPMDGTIGGFLRSTRHASERDLHRVCAMVGLDEWIAKLPLGFNAPISRGGVGFASHERRLLSLAHLLLLRPTVMVLDGILDALDERRAHAVSEAIARHAGAIVLLTARPEIVSASYRHQYLVDGQLRDERTNLGRPIVGSST